MSEFEPPAYDARAFWRQVKRGVSRLALPENVSDPKSEAVAWHAWHAYLASRTQPTWHFDSERFGDAMRTHWPGLSQVWIEESDRLIDGKMVYGESTVPYVPGVGLDWNANPDRTMNWGGLHYMFFLRWPIRAAMLTGEGKYVRVVADCVQSYLDQIDDIRDEALVLKRGVRPGGIYAVWNTLSVGLKLKALGEALYALRAHPDWTVADCRAASILIWRLAQHLHGQVASQTAVAWQQQLNFIASGSGGMGGVGALLPEWDAAEGWLETGRQIQEVLLLNQVYPDGFQKEICTQYHKTVIRSFATLQMILARRGLPSFYDTEPFRMRFLAMHRFLAEILTPDGFTPAINSAVYAQDWPAFLASGNTFFKDPVLQWHIDRGYHPRFVPVQKGGPGWGNTILNDLCVPNPTGERQRAPAPVSRLFPDSGIAVLRDGWDREANVLVLDFGHPEGGHAYGAQASFSAWVKGRPAALSPGSPFAYSDPDYRTWYHSTRGQNTVWIDEDDQDLWRPGEKRRIWGRLLDWRDEEAETYVRIAHEGYLRSKGVRHERTVLLKKRKYFLIYDLLDAAESDVAHTLRWTLRCPNELRETENRMVVSAGDPGIRLAPAWSDAIRDVEIGWGPSMVPLTYQADMSAQKAQVCHVRFVQEIDAGTQARFLVLMVSGDCRDGAVQGEVVDGRIEVTVTAWGETERIVLN
ncbi:MAG: alginate lyase family protein [Gemmatimonadota bacterium]|nr:alginate lyase family protein [Gemmatimonadota bacterium]